MIGRVAVAALALLVAALLDSVLLASVGWVWLRPSLVILTVVGYGLVVGPTGGSLYGFAAGLAVDLMTSGDHLVGLSALIGATVGHLSGASGPYLASAGVAGRVAAGGAATALWLLGAGLLGVVLGMEPHGMWLVVRTALASAAVNAVLAPFVVGVLHRLIRRVDDPVATPAAPGPAGVGRRPRR